MIKSYKYVLIIQILLLLLLCFFGSALYNDILDFNFRTLALLLIGLSPSLLVLLSIILQKILVAVINSDSLKGNNEKDINEEKIWKTTFFTYLVFCGVSLLASLLLIFFKSDINIQNYGEIAKSIRLIFVSITIASFIIAIFIRIKDIVWEVNKFVGILMISLSVLVFGLSLFIPSVNIFHFHSPEYDEVSAVTDTAYAVGPEGDEEYEIAESESDYYSFNEMDFSEVKTNGYFEKYYDEETDENSKSQQLLKLFLSRYLNLEKDQAISEIRSSITYGSYLEEYSEIQDIDKKMQRKPDAIREAFDSYKPLIYAFLSDKIYFESNLNVIVNNLIDSHSDIYAMENPEETLQKISTIMNMGYKKTFPDEYYDLLDPYISEKVANSLKENSERLDNEVEYNWKLNAVWIYSFWGRRFQEKNHIEVYKVLQEIAIHYEDN